MTWHIITFGNCKTDSAAALGAEFDVDWPRHDTPMKGLLNIIFSKGEKQRF